MNTITLIKAPAFYAFECKNTRILYAKMFRWRIIKSELHFEVPSNIIAYVYMYMYV